MTLLWQDISSVLPSSPHIYLYVSWSKKGMWFYVSVRKPDLNSMCSTALSAADFFHDSRQVRKAMHTYSVQL